MNEGTDERDDECENEICFSDEIVKVPGVIFAIKQA